MSILTDSSKKAFEEFNEQNHMDRLVFDHIKEIQEFLDTAYDEETNNTVLLTVSEPIVIANVYLHFSNLNWDIKMDSVDEQGISMKFML